MPAQSTPGSGLGTYWNHNTAYHRELVSDAAARAGAVLDVGCGDGLLMARMASVADEVVGVDADPVALERAAKRVVGFADPASPPRLRVLHGRFPDPDALARLARPGGYATVTCVATLHHMDTRAALEAMAGLLAPGGRLLIVGLARNSTVADWMISGLSWAPIRAAGIVHRECRDVGVRTAPVRESLRDIRRIAAKVIPGFRLRRRFYYRFTLTWTAPER